MNTALHASREIGKDIDLLRETIRHDLLAEFDREIAGQREAKLALIDTFLTGIFSLHRESCMGAVFLGWKTWVGKTQLIKTFAKILFWDSGWYTPIAGWKLKHPSDVTAFTGATPGFVGYGDTPLLADTQVYAPYKKALKENSLHPLLRKVYAAINISLVLVDEAEKMHPQVTDAFLSAMTDGTIRMAAWRETATKSFPIKYSLETSLLLRYLSSHLISEKQRLLMEKENPWDSPKQQKIQVEIMHYLSPDSKTDLLQNFSDVWITLSGVRMQPPRWYTESSRYTNEESMMLSLHIMNECSI